MQKAIDAHVHLSERKNDALIPYARSNGLRYTLNELLRRMNAHHVEKGLLLSPPMKDGGPLPNSEVIKLCQRSNGVLSPVVTVDPSKKEVDAAVELANENKKVVKAFKIRLGYTTATPEAPVYDRLYDYAEEEALPVLFHTGDTAWSHGDLALARPLNLDRLANKREELAIVICHFGNPWFETVAELIYKHPKVYTDMSGLTTGGGNYAKKFAESIAKKISEAIYFAGDAKKVIFGTDYPITKYADALALVDLLDVSKTDKERILWRNAKEVFRL